MRPVEFVSDDWMSQMGKVNSNLMISSGVQTARQQGYFIVPFQNRDVGSCGPRIPGLAAGGHQYGIPTRMKTDGHIYDTFVKVGNTVSQRDVLFPRTVGLKVR